ncbi:MAG: hypothetical protein ACYC2K_18740 [Gemmatimonadales bacterium]
MSAGTWETLENALRQATTTPNGLAPADMPDHVAGWLLDVLGPYLKGRAPFPGAAFQYLREVMDQAPTQGHAWQAGQAERWLDTAARATMAAEILATGCREITFYLTRQDDGRYGKPHVFARGSRGSSLAPPALPQALVLHNHPSGNLDPSEADLSAARAWTLAPGAGFGILDDAASRLYLIVEPGSQIFDAASLAPKESMVIADPNVRQFADCHAPVAGRGSSGEGGSGVSVGPVHSLATALPMRGLVDGD